MSPIRLSIIIPVVNEQHVIGTLLSDLAWQKVDFKWEVIIADGQSDDATTAICTDKIGQNKLTGRVVEAERGRARQMNTAVAEARGEWLLFLHADSRICDRRMLHSAVNAFQQRLRGRPAERLAGHFALRFYGKQSRFRQAYYFYERKTRLNLPDTINGDQGFLLSRRFFHVLGGFDESDRFMEDARLARLVFEKGQWMLLPGVIVTSARRFEVEGLMPRQILNALLCNFDAIGMRRYFSEAKAVYAEQSHSRRLALLPFLTAAHRVSLQEGWRKTFIYWYKTGHYVAGNVWQLPFMLDCRRLYRNGIPADQGRARGFEFYRRYVELLVCNPAGAVVCAAVIFISFYGLISFFWARKYIQTGF